MSRKRVDWAEEEMGAEGEAEAVTASTPAASNENLKGGIGSGEGPLFKAPGSDE